MNTQVPGIKAQHAIITKVCRANRTTDGAFDEAVARLRREYVACQNEANQEANFHLVLTVERLERASPVPEAPPLETLVDSVLRKSGFHPEAITNSELYADFLTVAQRAYNVGHLHATEQAAEPPVSREQEK